MLESRRDRETEQRLHREHPAHKNLDDVASEEFLVSRNRGSRRDNTKSHVTREKSSGKFRVLILQIFNENKRRKISFLSLRKKKKMAKNEHRLVEEKARRERNARSFSFVDLRRLFQFDPSSAPLGGQLNVLLRRAFCLQFPIATQSQGKVPADPNSVSRSVVLVNCDRFCSDFDVTSSNGRRSAVSGRSICKRSARRRFVARESTKKGRSDDPKREGDDRAHPFSSRERTHRALSIPRRA